MIVVANPKQGRVVALSEVFVSASKGILFKAPRVHGESVGNIFEVVKEHQNEMQQIRLLPGWERVGGE